MRMAAHPVALSASPSCMKSIFTSNPIGSTLGTQASERRADRHTSAWTARRHRSGASGNDPKHSLSAVGPDSFVSTHINLDAPRSDPERRYKSVARSLTLPFVERILNEVSHGSEAVSAQPRPTYESSRRRIRTYEHYPSDPEEGQGVSMPHLESRAATASA